MTTRRDREKEREGSRIEVMAVVSLFSFFCRVEKLNKDVGGLPDNKTRFTYGVNFNEVAYLLRIWLIQ
ncbi:hypothetical protein OUZ56_007936 [Daphnia magna]|uniref:Uncharacterized protein n=1 Tax=Daphnia magna TaxID=35525 RepID=A0ABR0ABF8_9CRUS|nr:hypothetical protein OUZ56_007936 [Daphnia magna]